MKFKRFTTALMSLSLAASLLVGCGNTAANNPPAASTTTEAASTAAPSESTAATTPVKPVKIQFYSLAWMPTEQKATQEVIDAWNKANPAIQVQFVQGSWSTIEQKMGTAFQTGTAPEIIHYWQPGMTAWMAKGLLADLSPMLDEESKNDVSADVWTLLSDKNGLVGALPFESEVDNIYYNKDMFAAKNIPIPTLDNPWTLDQMFDAAAKLTDASKGIHGIAINGLGQAGRFFNDQWATKAGLSPLTIDGTNYTLNIDGEYRDLLDKFKKLVKDGVMDKSDFTSAGDAEKEFMSGKAAILAGTGCYSRADFIGQDIKVNWGMLPPVIIKSAATYGAIQTVSVPAGSKNQDAAMEFLKYFWNTENQVKIAGSAYIFPGRDSAKAALNTDKDGWDMCYAAAKETVVPEYIKVPGWGNFMDGTGKTIYSQYLNNQISFDQFKSQLNTQLMQALNKYQQ